MKLDTSQKNLVACNDVFADICNGLLFDGQQIITEDSLQDTRQRSQYKADTGELHEEERDVSKIWNAMGMNLVLIGMENQTRPDRDMPFRVIAYDGAAYRSQLLDKRSKERYPVITMVLYFGMKPWNYATNLLESFRPKLKDSKEMNILRKYIQDYRVQVFDIPNLTESEVNRFQSDFRIVADYFTHARKDTDYCPDNAIIRHVDEFLKMMQIVTGDDRYEKVGKMFSEEDRKVGVSMCHVLERAEARGLEKGLEKGLEQGLEQGLEAGLKALVASLKAYISEPEVLYQVIVKNEAYQNVSKEEVLRYL